MTDAPFDATRTADRARLVHGGDEPQPERLPVRAGPLSLVIEAGDVRHVHVGAREVVRRIYGAVRDHAWRTIPARRSGFTLERGADTFRCRYRAEHRQDAVAFVWDATIEGAADGTLTFAFDGVAEATFERNRIGLCLLHPLPALSGARVRVTTSEGADRLLAFPDLVAIEQPIAGFDDIATLACEIGPDLWIEAAVDGDVFQAEDQRNWIDASTKIYSTPVTLPKPVTVPRGTRISQRVTLRLRTARGDAARNVPAPVGLDRADGALRFGERPTGRLPAIGIRSAAAAGHARPAYLRVDLDLDGGAAPAALAAHRGADAPPLELELALHLPDDAAAAARALERVDLAGVAVARVLAFTAGHDTTQPATLDAVRAWRARHPEHASMPIATGTPSDLARIHLAPAPLPAGDAVCWSMDPQAHATDLTTIAETPDGARDQARTVARRFGGLPLAVTATFGRHGQVDPRAASLFGAGWTLALLAALGEAGAHSVTLAEPWPDGDPSALPVVHVLAALATVRDAALRPVAATLDNVRAVAFERDDRCTLFVANLAPRDCEVTLPPAHDGRAAWTAWMLDADTPLGGGAATALIDRGAAIVASGRLALGPCAIARLDAARR